MMTTGLIRSPRACRRTVSVCTHTPSTQSTTTRAPSVTRRAAVTSEEKSTCPGESIRLIRNSLPKGVDKRMWVWHENTAQGTYEECIAPSVFCLMEGISALSISKYIDMAVDLMVIPRSFSSSLVSVYRTSPALAEAMIPAFETSESVRVDFPWSTEMERVNKECDSTMRRKDGPWAMTLMLRMLVGLSMRARI